MRKLSLPVMFLFFLPIALGAQDSQVLLSTFKRNFDKAERPEIKIRILEDAIHSKAEGMGPLYHLAIDYAVDMSTQSRSETQMKQLIMMAAEQIKKAEYRDARYSLWRLFLIESDTIVRVSILDTLSVIGQGDGQISRSISDWLANQNGLFLSGKPPDTRIIAGAVYTLGLLKDEVAFPVIFSAMDLSYSDEVSQLAGQALLSLDGDLGDNLVNVINSGSPVEKLSALKVGLANETLDESQKARVADAALEVGIYTTVNDPAERKIVGEIRRIAMKALGARHWSQSTNLAIEHFGMALLEYDRGTVTKAYLLEAVEGLGNMGTHEAAERLTLYLELVNSYTEHGRVYDEQIVLTVLSNLRKLGDKIAFANISYTQYLNYSDTVKKAAESAIDNLKW